MSTLPDSGSIAAIEAEIDKFGDAYDFERRDEDGVYQTNAEDVVMNIQPLNSTFLRAVAGNQNVDDYKGWIKASADVEKGDRVAIGSVYSLVTSKNEWPSHSEITLQETEVDA